MKLLERKKEFLFQYLLECVFLFNHAVKRAESTWLQNVIGIYRDILLQWLEGEADATEKDKKTMRKKSEFWWNG